MLSILDGLGVLAGQEAYWEYHHVVGHNLPSAVFVAGILTFFSTHRQRVFWVYLGLFHLHLVMDYFGSGPVWPICYFWPFTRWEIVNRNAWNLYSWQNISFGLAFLAWVIVIAVRKGRTPLETILPKLDVQLVKWFRKRWATLKRFQPS